MFGFVRRLRLRPLVFLVLLLVGAAPLAISTFLLIGENRELLETEEKRYLTSSAQSLSRELNDYLAGSRARLEQLGGSLLAFPGPETAEERLRQEWTGDVLGRFVQSSQNLLAFGVLDEQGIGPRLAPATLEFELNEALDEVFEEAKASRGPVWRFAVAPVSNEPVAALAVPVERDGKPALVVQALVRLHLIEAVFEREAQGRVSVFLVDRDGRLLWSEGADQSTRAAIAGSNLVRDFTRKPLHLTAEYSVPTDTGAVSMLGQVSPVEESGWGVVVQKPVAAAFEAARRMVWSAVAAAALLLALAALVALIVSRSIGEPIRRLIGTTHEIAAGNFGIRLEEERVVAEMSELASDFNRMSGYVEDYVDKLKQAAQRNRELFINSIRAFAAAIDAKDPYTRGHSERVAEIARTIARHLGQNEDFQQRLWIGGLLHDVGKIGIEDRILRKGGVLTAEEFEVMKTHTTMGADIIAPIEQLKEMIPIVRWHHENWNGKGYPDGLRGEEIPVMARIVAVADCFDAVTTNRPYQKAYDKRHAAEIITKLAGSRFDAKIVTAFLRAFEMGDLEKLVGATPSPAAIEVELPAAANI
ncbi:MAG TPA: HD domain-containing phosphohydrolase [Thermoanaerobaculia bacterium]|nr:HD domain-containing phosphohydrolase [Thermoanaerobaculia bacterium]